MATQVLVPPLGQTVDTVTLISWYRAEGDSVVQGEMLFAIETDKATLDIEAPASGVLCRVMVQPGQQVGALSPIALIAGPGEVLGDLAPPPATEITLEKMGEVSPAAQAPGSDPEQRHGDRIFISPRARRVADEHSIPLAVLTPSGPEGAIVERDVRAYLNSQAVEDRWSQAQIEREVSETIPMRGVRAVIAERMLQSVTSAAHVTLNVEAEATELVNLRRRLREDGLDVAYNHLLLYILGRVLRAHPRLNASLHGDTIQVRQRIHVGLAVDTERGLLVPVVRDVDRKGLLELAKDSQRLVERAQAGLCTPEELSGGTFTLTNLGMFGIDSFTPIINPPECAILGAGRIKARPAVLGDRVVPRQMMWLSLSFDHRLVDGAPAARFLQRVVQLIEQPHLLLAW